MFRKLMCLFFFHKLEKVKGYDDGVTCKVYCTRCKQYFGVHHGVKAFVPWDDELEALHNDDLEGLLRFFNENKINNN